MQKRANLGLKFTIVALGVGLFSPSLHLDTTKSIERSYSSISIPKIEINIFNQAEAAPVHRQARRVSRRTSRRVSRRHNVVYGGSRYYGGGYHHHHHHHHTGAAVAAGVVTGMAVGAAVAAPRYY
ncbi:hypothetical protein MNB_SV-6-975 [hydrothermal vent metagenome]|uniref:Uncharacterized protein n=1 Tax=hydrothermal vent metagenome TaxID=652676 RepID=A0A1W1C6T5_9ZZZZ